MHEITRILTLAAVSALACCTSEHEASADAQVDDAGAAPEPLLLAFAPMYSAYDGVHSFTLPVRVEGASGRVTVTTEPADFVGWEARDGGVLLSMRQAGTASVTFEDRTGRRGVTELFVTEATAEEWSLGENRYYNHFLFGPRAVETGDYRPCYDCHGRDHSDLMPAPGGGRALMEMFAPTPQQLGGYSDDALIATFGAGEKLAGSPFRALALLMPGGHEVELFRSFHARQQGDASALRGIVVFLRSLTPKAQPPLDFGGLTPGAQ